MHEQPPGPDFLHDQVGERFGFVPNFFRTAPEAPGLMEELWRFAKAAYLDSPLPSLFKERLFVHLSRFCEMRYCIARHVGFLLGKGHVAGDITASPQSIQQAIALLGRPIPDAEHLHASLAMLEKLAAPVPLPHTEAPLEGALFDALTILFVMPKAAERARAAVVRATGERTFELLTAFLAFVRTAHFWTETHPSLELESDMIALMHEHPELARLIVNTSEAEWAHSSQALRRALNDLHSTAGALRSSETRFQALVMASSDMLYRMDPDWSVLRTMEGRGFLADTSSPDAGWLQRYIPPAEQQRLKTAVAHAIATREVFQLEHQVLRIDGTVGYVLSRAIPIFGEDGAVTEWFGAAMDLTARRKADDELREADRRKDEFLATLAHELRNPLASLRTGLYLAKRINPPGAPLASTFEMMNRQLLMLIHLVDDLLDISRINTGKIQIRCLPLTLQDVLLSSLEAWQPALEAREHTLRVALTPERLRVAGDFDRLTQVFSNLLSNAIKYTERGGTIEVRGARVGEEAVVSIRDTGIGIAPADVPGIFALFSQVHAHREHADGGLGIGLSLVRQLVDMHGGSVAVASAGTGLGSTFTVRLPLWER